MSTRDRTVITLTGEWDIARRHELSERMGDAVEQTGPEGVVVVDLTQTAFIDSSSLSVLLRARQRLERASARLVTRVEDGSFTHRTLDRAGLIETLNVETA